MPTLPIAKTLVRMRSAGALCVFRNIRAINRFIEQSYDEAFEKIGMSASQVALLWTIHSTEPVGLATLERIMIADQTTISRVVARAQQNRWVKVESDPHDRRSRTVRLTASGGRKLASAYRRWEKVQESSASIVDPSVLLQIYRKIYQLRRPAEKPNRGADRHL